MRNLTPVGRILFALLKYISLTGGSLMIAGMYSDDEKQITKE
jgi:hypothetical protein